MSRIWIAAILCSLPALAQSDGRLQHIFQPGERMTGPSRLPAADVGRDFLRSAASRYSLAPGDADAATLRKEYRSDHNGVTHLVFRQQFQGLDVENGEWVVNVDSDGQVINAGGLLSKAPRANAVLPDPASALSAVRSAVRAVNPEAGRSFLPFQSEARKPGPRLLFSRGAFADDIDAVPVWFDLKGDLRAAWRFSVLDTDGVMRYAVVVDNESGKILAKRKLTFFQAPAPARGLVFENGSPQPNPTPGVALTAGPPLVERTLQPFAGDPVASPSGWVTFGETAGNNTVAGSNLIGFLCISAFNCVTQPATAAAANRQFSFPLQLGSGTNPTSFPDASTTNLFYWVNKSHDWFYSLGFNEAAGNFQRVNFGKGGVEGDPLVAYSLFGARYPQQPELNNAFFTTTADGEDGSQAMVAFYLETVGADYYDNSLDAATVVHEYSHGVSNRLVRRLNDTFQGGSMGEAWSDFFALEFLTPEGAPADGVYPFSEYPDQAWGRGIRTRPYSTRTDVNPLTFANLGHVIYEPEVHSDGEIWMEALWETRAALIQQFGEKEGRRRIRLLVIDGMKLSPPAPSMVDMRDSILLADHVDFNGASQSQLWAAFARRGLGALALSFSGNSVHVRPSFDLPSSTGSIRFYEDQYTVGETVTVVVQDSDLKDPTVMVQVASSGDVENVVLHRQGQVYVGSVPTDYAPVALNDGYLELISGDVVKGYYNDYQSPSGPRQASIEIPASLDYSLRLQANSFKFADEKPQSIQLTGLKRYSLPFPFPFFGKTYTSVWVQDTGLLSFESPAFAPCKDAASLALTNGIAPFWMDLTTFGGAQDGEDVYVSQDADSVTFRWAAETYPDYIRAVPQPVNFAATLRRDGRIEYRYGTGNRNLTGGSAFYGCNTSTPTVGISNGHETLVELVASHDGRGTLENAQTVVLEPPFNATGLPIVTLETPVDGAHVQGVLSGKGIAWDSSQDGGIRRIDVLIDNIAQDAITTLEARPDYCAKNPANGCPNVGFSFLEPLAVMNLKPGPHTLKVRVVNRRGVWVDAPQVPLTFTVGAGEPHPSISRIEIPADGASVTGTVTVKGYAYGDLYSVVGVDVLVDGVTSGSASYGATRSDVCAALTPPAPPNCPRVGFTYQLNTARLSNGLHQISLRTKDATGRYTDVLESTVSVTVKNDPAQLPKVTLGAPSQGQVLTGTVRVSGNAWAPAGKVARVRFYVDAYPMMDVPYGTPRPDVCAQLAGVAACPNIGFDGDFDTTQLLNGPHFIVVRVTDDKGNVTQFPNTLLGGIDVIVAN